MANQKEEETIKQTVDKKKEKKNKTKEEKTTPKKPLPPVPKGNKYSFESYANTELKK